MSIASWTSPAASGNTFPISRAISSASSSLWSASSRPKRKRVSPRRGAGTSRQSSYAAFAASTARSTSSTPERGKTPSTSPLAGLVVSKVSREAASTHSPPMKFLNVLTAVATAAILDGGRHPLEVVPVPGRLEAGACGSADREQQRAVLGGHGRPPHGGIRDRDEAHRRHLARLAVERERHRSLDHDVELLLIALALVVLGDERRARVAAEPVHTERAEPEVVLDRVPVEVVRVVGGHERQLVEPLHPVAASGHALRLRVSGRIRARKRALGAPAATVPNQALPAVGAPRAAILALTAVDDHGHVRVVPVVLDHLVVELVLELARDHAVDHPASDCMEARARRHSGSWRVAGSTQAGRTVHEARPLGRSRASGSRQSRSRAPPGAGAAGQGRES